MKKIYNRILDQKYAMNRKKNPWTDLLKIYNTIYFEGNRDLSLIRICKSIELLGEINKLMILDLGCGTGEGSSLLRQLGGTVICVDIAKYAVCSCKRLGFEVVQAAGHALPFKANSFDGSLIMDLLEHIPKNLAVTTLKNIKMVTKTNGKVAIHTMPHLFLEKLSILYGLINKKHWRRRGIEGGHINTYTPWRLKKEINLSGLRIVKFNIGPYPKSAPFSRLVSPISRHIKKIIGNDFWVCCIVNHETKELL